MAKQCKVERGVNGRVLRVTVDTPKKILQQSEPRFSLAPGSYTSLQVAEALSERLQQTGLAKVNWMNRQQIQDFLRNLGISDDVLKQVEVWHGSPYLFKKFLLEKIGMGEGAQYFGWGLYFTELKQIAKYFYADTVYKNIHGEPKTKLTSTEFGVDIKEYSRYLPFSDVLPIFLRQLNEFNPHDILKYVKYLKETEEIIIGATKTGYKVKMYKLLEVLEEDILENRIEYERRPPKVLYNVTLHKGKSPEEYTWLEWDRPVSKEIIGKLGINLDLEVVKNSRGLFSIVYKSFPDRSPIGAMYKTETEARQELKNIDKKPTGAFLYNILSKQSSPKEASLLLLEKGIDGIKYPAESISRGITSDNARGFNYVVFDENAITIEEVIQFSKAGVQLTPNGFYYNGNSKFKTFIFNNIFLHL